MRSVDRLERQKRIKEQQRKQQPVPEEETQEELEFPRFVPLNKAFGAFDETQARRYGGINTAPSVFDKKSVFRSDEE